MNRGQCSRLSRRLTFTEGSGRFGRCEGPAPQEPRTPSAWSGEGVKRTGVGPACPGRGARTVADSPDCLRARGRILALPPLRKCVPLRPQFQGHSLSGHLLRAGHRISAEHAKLSGRVVLSSGGPRSVCETRTPTCRGPRSHGGRRAVGAGPWARGDASGGRLPVWVGAPAAAPGQGSCSLRGRVSPGAPWVEVGRGHLPAEPL